MGDGQTQRIRRVMRAPVKLLGDYSQTLPSNWKLYMENVKDTYHASLLHLFFTTFRINRLSQRGIEVTVPTRRRERTKALIIQPSFKTSDYIGMLNKLSPKLPQLKTRIQIGGTHLHQKAARRLSRLERPGVSYSMS